MTYKDSYSPVDPDFDQIFERLMMEKRSGKIFYFNPKHELDEISGAIQRIVKQPDGEFLETKDLEKVRLDKIITMFGKPGPAYDEYDRYGNACLTCEDLGQF